jgi:hypothetical protein
MPYYQVSAEIKSVTVSSAAENSEANAMNDRQRKVLVTSLFIIGIALIFVMLEWGSQYDVSNPSTAVWIFNRSPDLKYPNLVDEWGIYTPYGVIGLLLAQGVSRSAVEVSAPGAIPIATMSPASLMPRAPIIVQPA